MGEFQWDKVPSQFRSGTDPAAGAEVSDAVPAGKRWLFMGVALRIACSAGVANRTPIMYLQTGGRTMRMYTFGVLTASQTADLGVFPDAVTDTSGTWQQISLGSPVELPATTSLITGTINIQAADDYAAPIYHIKEAPA